MIPDWYPAHPPLYDIKKTYAQNALEGPFFKGPIPERPLNLQPIDLFGHSVRSPIGVPAGPLLNARWIALAAKLGFDILTYKTIRSEAHPGHPLPNIIYVEPTSQEQARPLLEAPLDPNRLTITNSFGMPSMSREFLLHDIHQAQRSIQKGQVLIVSVVGSMHGERSFLEDFILSAQIAKEAGAKIIEANFSCPNVDKAEGCLYLSPDTTFTYVKALVQAIHPLPLIIKVGLFPHIHLLEEVLVAIARAGAQGVCGLNSVSMQVLNEKGESPLGKNRTTSGICGAAIRSAALQFTQEAASCIREENLDLTLLGCGGIMQEDQFELFLEAGAKAALSATGMMWDPFLALRYHQRQFNACANAHSPTP